MATSIIIIIIIIIVVSIVNMTSDTHMIDRQRSEANRLYAQQRRVYPQVLQRGRVRGGYERRVQPGEEDEHSPRRTKAETNTG